MAVTELDRERAHRFLRLLSEESFICVVDTGKELRIFSKGIEPEQLDRIKHMLEQSTEQETEPHGEDEDQG